MARIVVSEFLSLDGVMQAPGGVEEDRTGGFEHGGWEGPYFDDAAGRAVDEAMAKTDGLLLGRRTYDIFAGYWPSSTEEPGLAERLNSLPKYVVSTTLEEPLEWNNSSLIKDDVPNQLSKLKELPGRDLLVFGSGDLAQTLMEHDLIDEYRLMVHPIVLGSGKRLFREGNPRTGLRLVDSTISSTGTLIATYAPERPK
ncbi:MAG: dihydrofolate reductase family protein [Actinomycetota bacterium]